MTSQMKKKAAPKVLFIDDEPNVLSAMSRQFRRKFQVHLAQSGPDGLAAIINHGPFDVLVTDMRMPGMDGLQFVQKAQEKAPDSVRIMLTGNADQQTAVRAINEGNIFRFYTKPCDLTDLEAGIWAAAKQYQLVTSERVLLQRTLAGSVKVLVDMLAILEPSIFGRRDHLRKWAKVILNEADIEYRWDVDIAVLVAPLGKMALPIDILVKLRENTALTDEERKLVQKAPLTAKDLIANIPRLGSVSAAVKYQEKGYDGSGFPDDEVSGEKIPLGGRMLKLLNDMEQAFNRIGTLEGAVQALEKNEARYDPRLFWAAHRAYGSQSANNDTDEEPGRERLQVRVDELRPGDRLLRDVRNRAGTLIQSGHADLSRFDVERLCNNRKVFGLEGKISISREARSRVAAHV